MKTDERPIGFFDSGVGGLSVLKATMALLPKEKYVFLGDSANVPYGEKTEEEILRLSVACGDLLYEKGVKMIVVACNTATSIAVKTMRSKFNMPVISIEPAVKPALDSGKKGAVIVLATPATMMQERYNALLERLGQRERVINIPCGGLAELVEGCAGEDVIYAYLKEKFEKNGKEDAFGAVLGCTHYSFIEKTVKRAFSDVFKRECNIFDGKDGVARQVRRVLDENGIAGGNGGARVEFYSTGNESETEKYRRFLNL